MCRDVHVRSTRCMVRELRPHDHSRRNHQHDQHAAGRAGAGVIATRHRNPWRHGLRGRAVGAHHHHAHPARVHASRLASRAQHRPPERPHVEGTTDR
jgi:hypothetical protein